MRAFVAVDLPSPRAALGLPVDARASDAPDHLTLRFLGETDERRLPELRALLQAVAERAAPFRIELRGLGAFPDPRRPRLLYAEVGEGRESVVALAAAVESALAPVGLPPSTRPFRPHLTLLRVRNARDLERALGLLGASSGATLSSGRVDELLLKASELRPEGALHAVVGRFPLGKQSGERTEPR